jgi:hypothetical protein
MKKLEKESSEELRRSFVFECGVIERRRKKWRFVGIIVIGGSFVLMFYLLDLFFEFIGKYF